MESERNSIRADGKPTDETLVRLYLDAPESTAGKSAANRLLSRYTGRVHSWCVRMVGDRELALDLAQDALLSAYRALPRFRGDARFSSWLFAIVRNRCRSHLRTRPLLGSDEDPDGRPSRDKSPAAALEEKESAGRLLALLKRALTATEQEALWLRCFEGLPVDEITHVLDVRGSAGARGLLQTARRKLRAAMERAG